MFTTCTSITVTIIVLAFAAGSVIAFYAERKDAVFLVLPFYMIPARGQPFLIQF